MTVCIIMGDSIAVGVAQHRPECVALAKGGITSLGWLRHHAAGMRPAEAVLISLGTNDPPGAPTLSNLRVARATVSKGARVYWLLPPIKPDVQAAVRTVAAENNDVVVPLTQLSSDKIHPTRAGYKALAQFP